jgi:DNA polymerase I
MSSGSMPETLFLVDAFSLIFQVFHAIPPMTSPSGLPTNAVFGFTKDMLFLRNEKRPAYLICLFDSGPTFRDQLYAEYKAHRAPMPDDLQLQIPMIRDMLEALRIPVLTADNFEADDLIATLAVAGAARGLEVFICSSDKDCRQLLADKVKIFNIRKLEIFDEAALLRDWGVRPGQVIDYQTLVGDSVDNVPGVVGVGPKTASKYLQDYQTLDNLVAHVEDLAGKKKDNLKAALPLLEKSRRLVTLETQVPVAFDWDGWRVQPWDAPRLLELCRGWGFHRFADQVRASQQAAPPPPRHVEQGSLFGPEANGVFAAPAPAAEWKHQYHLVNSAADFAIFLQRLRQQKRFAVDLETTSLDPQQAELVGLAFAWEAGEAYYLAVRGPAGEPVLDPVATLAQLKPILEGPAAKVNQNIKYDWQIFARQGIQLAGITGDPMLADYLLHAGERSHGMDVLAEKHLGHRNIPITDLIGKGKNQLRMDQVPTARVAEYSGEDADVAWRLCAKLETELEAIGFKRPHGTAEPASAHYLYGDLEIPLIEVLATLEFTGIRLDTPLLARMSRDMAESLERLEQEIHTLAGRAFNIASVKQLREILFAEKGFKSGKKTAITGAASVDQETLEALAREGHELPKKLLEHRKIAKLKSTYVDALPALVSARTGRVHASFNQTVAATGRLSSSEPNLQNIPIRSEMGGQIRQAFLPEQGWLLLTADYSQIELRLLAHFSGDAQLRQAYRDGLDIHTLVAAQIFSVAPTEVTGAMRGMAKTVNFGVIYGMSAFGLAQRLEISKEEAARFIDAYFARYPRVLDYQEELLAACRKNGYVSTIFGRRRTIQGLRELTTYKQRNQPEREAINMQIQGSAADLIKVAMLKVQRRLRHERLRSRMLLQIHDELVFEFPPDERAAIISLVREEMTGALAERLEVPLGVDLGIGPNWLDTADVQEGAS